MASRSKSKSTMPTDLDEGPPLSQPSSDDGMAAVLIQKMHSTAEKRRKERDARYLKTYRKETLENARSALEFSDRCAQVEKAFADFLMAYAKSEDEIRAIWVKIAKAQEPFTVYIREQIAAEIQQEKEREDRQLLGVAYHKKSEESLDRIIESLLKDDPE